MRVMMLIIAAETAENRAPPTAEAFEAMERFNDDLVQAGVLVAGAGLKPSSEGRRIVFDDADGLTVIDGPFAEMNEVVAGWSIWQVKDMDEAVAWARRCPNPMAGRSQIELRPFIEAADMTQMLAAGEASREALGVA